ncbi:Uma2 family endonuclease [Streptomyces cinnamoneus]|uniref:Uma2 family endonuclease n=1 Tax=Streptomyces cinnamoneus TaxID=53446 RepID=UPI0033F306F1
MGAVRDSARLDEMFVAIEHMNLPPGFRVEIVEGAVVLNEHRAVHSRIVRELVMTMDRTLGREANIIWNARVDFPGALNGYVPDVALLREGAEEDEAGNHDYRDVEFVAEVVSQGSRRIDHGIKRDVYALAGVPTYLIADPMSGLVHVYHQPREGAYIDEAGYVFGAKFTLPYPGVTIDTSDWPRDRRAPRD